MAEGEAAGDRAVQDQVTIRMPAEGAYLSVLRTATAGLAARLDFTLDEIEDLRIAVDEACGMLLTQAAPGADLVCDFTLGEDRMSIAVSTLAVAAPPAVPRHLRLDGALGARGQRGRVGRAGRQGHRRAQEDTRVIEARVTGETETRLTESVSTQVTEEIEITVTEGLDGPAGEAGLAATPKIQHAVPDRGRARDLFERLATLPEDDQERLRIRGELVELHLPLVEYLARRFRNRGEWLDDLTQVATIGLIKSIDRFDLARGVEFSTYATPTIVGEIKRHFRDKGWAVRVPRRLQELKLALTKAIGDLAQRQGRAPTVAEIAAHLQMTEEEVLEGLESANAYSTVSLDAPDSGDDDAPAVAESLGMLDDALEGVEYRESLKPLLEQLPPREKRILLLRFFGNMTQSQIASELGISQMHVSRLLARTLTQLRAGLTADD